jgi:hypothetical protein
MELRRIVPSAVVYWSARPTLGGKLGISISQHGVAVAGVLGNLTSRVQYDYDKVDGFGASASGLFFRYGVRRIEFDGTYKNEFDWLEQQLNEACKTARGAAGPDNARAASSH